jgi:hypothetical protein
MADPSVGSALTGEYYGEVDPDRDPEDYKQWGAEWSEVLPLEGLKPQEFMKLRPAGEEGATMKGMGDNEVIFLRRKPKDPPLTS